MQGRTGGLQYSDRLEFMVLDADGRREDGFLSSELVGVKKGEGNEMIFETQNSTYRFQVLF